MAPSYGSIRQSLPLVKKVWLRRTAGCVALLKLLCRELVLTSRGRDCLKHQICQIDVIHTNRSPFSPDDWSACIHSSISSILGPNHSQFMLAARTSIFPNFFSSAKHSPVRSISLE